MKKDKLKELALSAAGMWADNDFCLDEIRKSWNSLLNERIELLAAAFLKVTDLDPREAKIVHQVTGDGMKIWLEPFPDGSEIEMYRQRAERAEAELAALKEMQKIHKRSWFYRNCRTQRKRGAKICQVCPFRKLIEQQEAE